MSDTATGCISKTFQMISTNCVHWKMTKHLFGQHRGVAKILAHHVAVAYSAHRAMISILPGRQI